MSVEHIEFLVEEPSTEAFLRGLLPRLLGTVTFAIYSFQCKNDLLVKLPQRLIGYASWLPPTHRIVVLVDCDDDDCRKLKQRLEACAQQAGMPTRSRPINNRFLIVNRIIVEELEAWYFGD